MCIYSLACLDQLMLSLVNFPSISAYVSLFSFSCSLNVSCRIFWAFTRVLCGFQEGIAVKITACPKKFCFVNNSVQLQKLKLKLQLLFASIPGHVMHQRCTYTFSKEMQWLHRLDCCQSTQGDAVVVHTLYDFQST